MLRKKKNKVISKMHVLIFLGLICIVPLFANGQRKLNLLKNYSIADDWYVKEARISDCCLLAALDSLMMSQKNTFPDKFWLKMPTIGLIIDERCDTTVHYYGSDTVVNHKTQQPTPDNIRKIFEGGKPSNDIKVIFSPSPYPGDYAIIFNKRFYEVHEHVYAVLKHNIRFRPRLVKFKFWMLRTPYQIPVFSIVITKDGEYTEFKYSTIDFYDMPVL